MKKIFRVSVLATGLVAAVAASAQAQGNPLQAGSQRTYDIVKGYITRPPRRCPRRTTPSNRPRTCAASVG